MWTPLRNTVDWERYICKNIHACEGRLIEEVPQVPKVALCYRLPGITLQIPRLQQRGKTMGPPSWDAVFYCLHKSSLSGAAATPKIHPGGKPTGVLGVVTSYNLLHAPPSPKRRITLWMRSNVESRMRARNKPKKIDSHTLKCSPKCNNNLGNSTMYLLLGIMIIISYLNLGIFKIGSINFKGSL